MGYPAEKPATRPRDDGGALRFERFVPDRALAAASCSRTDGVVKRAADNGLDKKGDEPSFSGSLGDPSFCATNGVFVTNMPLLSEIWTSKCASCTFGCCAAGCSHQEGGLQNATGRVKRWASEGKPCFSKALLGTPA